jgi:hypothetical protein
MKCNAKVPKSNNAHAHGSYRTSSPPSLSKRRIDEWEEKYALTLDRKSVLIFALDLDITSNLINFYS